MTTKRALAKQYQLDQKDVVTAVKKAVVGSGWKIARNTLHRAVDGWFIAADLRVGRETKIGFSAKPLSLDELYWRIVGLEDNISRPLSFRVNAVFKCDVPIWAETSVAAAFDDPGATAKAILEWVDSTLESQREGLNIDFFLETVRRNAVKPRYAKVAGPFHTLATTLVLAGKNEEAKSLCEAATRDSFLGSASFGVMSFPELVLNWLEHPGQGPKWYMMDHLPFDLDLLPADIIAALDRASGGGDKCELAKFVATKRLGATDDLTLLLAHSYLLFVRAKIGIHINDVGTDTRLSKELYEQAKAHPKFGEATSNTNARIFEVSLGHLVERAARFEKQIATA